MKEILKNNITKEFATPSEMNAFLKGVDQLDTEVMINLNSVKTHSEGTENLFLSGTTTEGERVTIPLWPFAIKALERRSGDTAVGHQMMSNSQILQSMNNYWPLHKDGKVCKARIRGEKLLSFDSPQYEVLPQCDLFEELMGWLKQFEGVVFQGGFYSHELTKAYWDINDGLPINYKRAWKNAGFSEAQLDESKLKVRFITSDISESSAKAIITVNVSGTEMMVGNPVFIAHRQGYGGVADFRQNLDKSVIQMKEELELMAKLMQIKIENPEEVLKKAIKKCGIEKISKKSCKELLESTCFFGSETAYTIYLYLNGVLNTSYAKDFADDKKFRISAAIKTLLKEDWTKF